MNGPNSHHRVWAIAVLAAVVVSIIGVAVHGQTAAPYVSVEGFVLFKPGDFDEETLKLVRASEAAAARGDLSSALESMRRAVAHHHEQPAPAFELWDNLAELYCARAASEADATLAKTLRSKGLALLQELRCGADLWDAKTMCRDVPDREGLCFRTLCRVESGYATGTWDSLRDADFEPGTFTWYRDDVKNLPAIERICRR